MNLYYAGICHYLKLKDRLKKDYFKNPQIKKDLLVNDVSTLNATKVKEVAAILNLDHLESIVQQGNGDISVGGGRFSQGGQTSSQGSTFLDMRSFNKILDYNPHKKTIRVQSGVRWCDIQKIIDKDNLAIKIMQTYANFTVGGALSVNAHGRYVNQGGVINSVQEILLVTPTGTFLCSREKNTELFNAAIGGYGAVGVIAEITLELRDNVKIKQENKVMHLDEYHEYFQKNIKYKTLAVLHNAHLKPPFYQEVNAVTWTECSEEVTNKKRLHEPKRNYPGMKLGVLMSSSPVIRSIAEPLAFKKAQVHWLNFEAGKNVKELEFRSRQTHNHLLQEYFIPVDKLETFVDEMSSIFHTYKVKAINVSIRHSPVDKDSLLSWAKTEVYSLVIYYEKKDNQEKEWTNELIDSALEKGGSYYLPYQIQATKSQFKKAYPNSKELFALKKKVDPEYKLKNPLWEKFY